MSTYSEFFPLRFINDSGEDIPAYAVMQVSDWEDRNELGFLKVKKPDGEGKIFILNGTRPVLENETGRATTAISRMGAFALFEDAETPEIDQEWGPVADKWTLTKDKIGFFIIGDIKGDPASAPGLPPTPSTKRVRVTGIAGGAKATIRGAYAIIRGTVPASSGITAFVNLDTPMVNPGKLEPNPESEGAWLVNHDGTPIQDDEFPGAPEVVGVINPSETPFHGGSGRFRCGTLTEVTETVSGEEVTKKYFNLPADEICTRPGFDPGKGNLVMVQPNDNRAEMVVAGWNLNDKSLGANGSGDAQWQDDGPCQTAEVVAS